MRAWTVYEQNQLLKYGLWGKDLSNFGEMPVEYIVGKAEFGGLKLFVSPAVLIPRIETESLVNLVVEHLSNEKKLRIVDVGTGSGAIAILLAKRLVGLHREFEMTATDISQQALEVARKNLHKYKLESKVKLQQSNLLEQIEDRFDIIVANLPYIPEKRKEDLLESVIKYEPHLALFGGDDGLYLIKELIKQAKVKLNPGGQLWLEVDDSHTFEQIATAGFTTSSFPDQFGVNRFYRILPVV